jgi:predicted ATPase with chaperone activity
MRIILPRLSSPVLEIIAESDAQEGTELLRDAAETMRLAARGYHRVLRVARTGWRRICGARREIARFHRVSRVFSNITRRFGPPHWLTRC